MSRISKETKRCLTYADRKTSRWVALIKIGKFVFIRNGNAGQPLLTIAQTERFANKMLAMCADARKEKS